MGKIAELYSMLRETEQAANDPLSFENVCRIVKDAQAVALAAMRPPRTIQPREDQTEFDFGEFGPWSGDVV